MKIHNHVVHYAHKFFEHAREALRKKEEDAKHHDKHKTEAEKKSSISTTSVGMAYKKAENKHALIRHAVSMHKKHHFAKGQTAPRENKPINPLVAHAVKGFKVKHGKNLQGAKK